jgi:hypothetical protein
MRYLPILLAFLFCLPAPAQQQWREIESLSVYQPGNFPKYAFYAQQQQWPAQIQKVVDNLCTVNHQGSAGSGCLLESKGRPLVLTCGHLVDAGRTPGQFQCFFPKTGETILARSIFIKHGPGTSDLNILELDRAPRTIGGIKFNSELDDIPGQSRYVIGFAGSNPQQLRVRQARILRVGGAWGTGSTPDEGPVTVLQCTTEQGTSGGPVVDENGVIRSVITAGGGGEVVVSSSQLCRRRLQPVFPLLNLAGRIVGGVVGGAAGAIGGAIRGGVQGAQNGADRFPPQCPTGQCPAGFNPIRRPQPTPQPVPQPLPQPPEPTPRCPCEMPKRVERIEADLGGMEKQLDSIRDALSDLQNVKPITGPVGPVGPAGRDGVDGKDGRGITDQEIEDIKNAVVAQVGKPEIPPEVMNDLGEQVAEYVRQTLPKITVEVQDKDGRIARRTQDLSQGDASFRFRFHEGRVGKPNDGK